MKLKPLMIMNTHYPRNERYRQNTARQIMLLNALKITNDPEKLKNIIGVQKVADVFRTLDKIALRKEYHKALVKYGIDFEYIVKGLKTEIEAGEKSADRLKGLQILLKSMGMESYDVESEGGEGSWEDMLVDQKKKIEEGGEIKQIEGKEINKSENGESDYEVQEPIIPDSIKRMKQRDDEIGRSIYD